MDQGGRPEPVQSPWGRQVHLEVPKLAILETCVSVHFSFREGTAYMEARLGLGRHGRQAPVVSNKLCWRPEQTALHVRKLHRTWAGTEWVSNSYADGGPSIALLTEPGSPRPTGTGWLHMGLGCVCYTLSVCQPRPSSEPINSRCVKPETGRSSVVLQKAHMVKPCATPRLSIIGSLPINYGLRGS